MRPEMQAVVWLIQIYKNVERALRDGRDFPSAFNLRAPEQSNTRFVTHAGNL